MAEENRETIAKSDGEQVEVSDRSLFDFMAKKVEGEKSQEEVMVTGVEKLNVEETDEKFEGKKEEEKELRRSHSAGSSSSSDEEEVGPDGEKKKKKKGLKEKINETVSGGHPKKEPEGERVTAAVATEHDVVVEKIEEKEKVKVEAAPEGEKKGFLEKIKEKLPGHHKKEAEACGGEAVKEVGAPHQEAAGEGHDVKEKKGILGKIMDKLPGHHPKEEADKNAPPVGH